MGERLKDIEKGEREKRGGKDLATLMAALLLGFSSPSSLLLHLLLCSLFAVVPGRAATPRRHHPAPGDARTLAESDSEIRPAWTAAWLESRHEYPNWPPGATGRPVASSLLNYNGSYVSEPTFQTGRCDQRPPGDVQKGVVLRLLAPLFPIGKKRSVQRTRPCSCLCRVRCSRVSVQHVHQEQGCICLDKSARVWRTGPKCSSLLFERVYSAANTWARPPSAESSDSNVTGSVVNANKLDKWNPWITDSLSRGLLNAIDSSTEGWKGCLHAAAGNSIRSRTLHLSGPLNICLKSCRVRRVTVSPAACSKRFLNAYGHQAIHNLMRTEWSSSERNIITFTGITLPSYLSCKNITLTDTPDLNEKLRDERGKCNQKYPQNQGKTCKASLNIDGCHVSQCVTDFTGNPFRPAETEANYQSTSKCISSFTDSPVKHWDVITLRTPPFKFSAQLNFTETSCVLHAHTGTWNSNKNGTQDESASDIKLNFVQSLLLWNYNSNNNNNKLQNDFHNNSGTSDKSISKTGIVQPNSKKDSKILAHKVTVHVPCSQAHLDSIPVESPQPACADSTTGNSLATNRGATQAQLKSGKGLPLQAEDVSQRVEQVGVSGGRRKGEMEREVREEEDNRGKGTRQYGKGGSDERGGWVNADSTKKEVSKGGMNLLRKGGRDQGSDLSQTAGDRTVRGDENKNGQQIKKTGEENNESNINRDLVVITPIKVSTVTKQTEKESNKKKIIDDYEYLKEKLGKQPILPPVGRSRRAANRHPHFPQYNYQIQVAENQPPSTSVISMLAEDPDPGEAGRLSYSMAPLMNSRSMDYFQIDPMTGLITSTHVLDREHMDLHYFRITATDHGSPRLSGTTMVAITISDRNDHSPVFEQTEYRETIRENVEEGYPILQLRATDHDSQANANIRYRFIGESAAVARYAFEIDPRSGLITTRGIVDREVNERYTLQVEANDQGREPGPRSATVNVHITVLDENDNVPQFSQKRYIVAVREDVRPHSEILRVSATDEDKDGNAAVHYNIISGNSRGQFAIDSVTGEIQVVAPLDFETEREYTLRLRAQDNGRPPLSNSTGIVSVQVTDVNDNPPIFVSTPFQATVLESAPVGHSVLHIQAIDTDNGDNARLEYRLTGTGTDTPFVINAATGWVSVKSELDRESVEHYFFGVEARDYGAPPLSATASVTITVLDVNDNRPEFLQKEYYVRLNEDAAVGTSVVSVTAVDRDVNSAVTYQITGGNTRNRFAISTAGGAGLLSLALPLDYKQERRYVLTVTASDRTLHDTCQVHVNITDANTHRPVFQSAHYSVSVNEDRPPGSTVVVISATDDDVGENARITYFLEDNIPQFQIDPSTGAITLQAELDYEDQMTYTLAITARDNGIPQKSDTTYVEVNVNDVNDNAPQFLSPHYQGRVFEDAPPFTSVLQISATDRDAHANGRVQYTFQNGEDGDGDFTIEPTSGIVRTVRRLDRESVPFYELTAFAVDRGVPPQRTPVRIQVSVMDVNDNAPVFPADDFEVRVKENSAVGSVVAQITATDPDEGSNAQIMYQIVEGNIPEIFQMDIFSGELTSLIDLDYEMRNEYVIVVQATSAPLVSRATVRIRLIDQNDNSPEMKNFQIIFNNFVSNRSNTFPSGVIGRVPAHDPDVTDRLYYTIEHGNELHLLLLNHTSGEIRLSSELDNNRQLVAHMLITVTGKSM